MKKVRSVIGWVIGCCVAVMNCQFVSAQEAPILREPTDGLSKEFHAGRREALRNLMPANSVTVVFAYPERVFSKDVSYNYHPNPDLYYLTGYKEPEAVLFVFKEMQQRGDSSYNELFFVRKRDAAREQWNGRRLGVDGVKEKLGFKYVYNGEDFKNFPIDLTTFSIVLQDIIPDDIPGAAGAGELKNLMTAFLTKMKAPLNEDKLLQQDLISIASFTTPQTLPRTVTRLVSRQSNEAYKNNPYVQQLIATPDSATLAEVSKKIKATYGGITGFNKVMGALREIKTPEELTLLRKSVEISSIAHLEAMKAIQPGMSEKELEGTLEYVHKKYGAEGEGYPPIVGAGENGCILHYIENTAPQVQNQLVLMDVASEYHGYSADVTRTIPANGKFSEEQKAIYQIVYDAQEEVFKLCKEDVPFSQLNEKSKEILANGLIKLGIIKNASEVGKYYMHGVSHHMGLDVHDRNQGKILKENMVITVEPGIYIPKGSPCDQKWWDIAVRIEDDVRIGKDACEMMSGAAPRKWDEVEKAIAQKSVLNKLDLPALSAQ